MTESIKILLADCEKMKTDQLVAFLERAGYEVIHVDNGRDALRYISESSLDLREFSRLYSYRCSTIDS
jgi:DNA-binding response OmpR family regulator